MRQHRKRICQSPQCLQPWSLWTDTSRINHFHHTSGTSWIRFMFPDFRELCASKTRCRKNPVYKYDSTSNERDWMFQVSCWASLCNKKVLTQTRIWVQPWICYFLKLNFLNIFKCIYFYIYFIFFRKCDRPHMVTNNDRFKCFGLLVRGWHTWH